MTRRVRVALIVNPCAANGGTGKKWSRIQSRIKDRLGPFQAHLTTGPGDATRLARSAVTEGVETVVCVGGDGTLNEVVNGVMGGDPGKRANVRVGYLPQGTGCDLARVLSIPRDLEGSLDTLVAGETKVIDLGRITYRSHGGQTATRYFHNVVSFGLGGEVVERVNRTTKLFGGFVSFIWATLITILLYRQKRLTLAVDEEVEEEFTAWNVAVANGQYHGGGMWVAPDADISDGCFQLTVVGDMNRPQILWNLPLLYNGRIYEHPKVMKLAGERIKADCAQRVLLDLDGEQPGRLPALIEMIPACLPVICPVQP